MKSQKISQILPEIFAGRIYMLYLPEKKGYWPVSVCEVLQNDPKTKYPAKVKFSLFNPSNSQQSFRNKIDVDLKNICPEKLIPFESVYDKKSQSKYDLESLNRSKKESTEFKKVMHQASLAFESNLKTVSMYQALKKQYKNLSNESKMHKNQSQQSNLNPTSKKVNFSRTQTFKNTQQITSTTRKVEQSTSLNRVHSKIWKQNPQKFQQSSKSASKNESVESKFSLASRNSQGLKNGGKQTTILAHDTKKRDLKRGQTEFLINNLSTKNLQCPKKKRKNSKNDLIIVMTSNDDDQTSMTVNTSNGSHSESLKVQKVVKFDPKKIEISSCRLSNNLNQLGKCLPQRKYIEKSIKSSKIINRKIEIRKSTKIKNQETISQNQKIQTLILKKFENKPSNINQKSILGNRENVILSNKNQPRHSLKPSIPSNFAKLISLNTKKQPNNLLEIQSNPSLQKSLVSNRTRSKKYSSIQTTQKSPVARKKRSIPQNQKKVVPIVRKAQNYIQTQKASLKEKTYKKNPKSKTSTLSNLNFNLSKNSKIQEAYKSFYNSGTSLSVESFFPVFYKVFELQKNEQKQQMRSKRQSKTNQLEGEKYKSYRTKVYGCLIRKKDAKKLENEVKSKKQLLTKKPSNEKFNKNIQFSPKVQNLKKIELKFQESVELEDETPQLQNFSNQQKISSNLRLKKTNQIEKIIEEKEQQKIKSNLNLNIMEDENQVKQEEEENSSFEEIKDSQMNVNSLKSRNLKKNMKLNERISMKYKMNEIQSFEQFLNFNHKEAYQKNILIQKFKNSNYKIAFSQSDGMNLQSNHKGNLEGSEDQYVFVFVVEKIILKNKIECKNIEQHGINEQSRSKITSKQPSTKKTKRSLNSSTKKQVNLQKIIQAQYLFEESMFIWSIERNILHGIFTSLIYLETLISINENLTKDIHLYKNFEELFNQFSQNELIQSNSNLLNKTGKYFQSFRKSNKLSQSASITIKSQIIQQELPQNKRKRREVFKPNSSAFIFNKKEIRCSHKFCSKLSKSDQNFFKNLFKLFSFQIHLHNLSKQNTIYISFIEKATNQIIKKLLMYFNDDKSKRNQTTFNEDIFKQKINHFYCHNLHKNKFQQLSNCFIKDIFICIGKVLHLNSPQPNESQLNGEEQKIHEINDFLSQKSSSNKYLKSNITLQNGNFKKSTKVFSHKTNSKVNYNQPFKYPKNQFHEEVHDSPFQIVMGNSIDEQYSSQKTQNSQLESSRKTEFDRNSDDFGSFLSRLLPNVDKEKHERNFRKYQKTFRQSEQYQNNPSENQSLIKDNLTEVGSQMIENCFQKINFQNKNPLYRSNALHSSIQVMNTEAKQKKSDKIRVSALIFNQIQSNTTSVADSEMNHQKIEQEKASSRESDSADEYIFHLKEDIMRHLEQIEHQSRDYLNLKTT